ncbi:MAG: spore coat protein [Bacillota bacterium]
MSILGTKVKEKTNTSDEVIANNLKNSAAAMANAYLNAALAAPTPEFRSICKDSLEQILTGHAQISKLIAEKGWDDPYDSSEKQLLDVLRKSQTILDANLNE